MKYVYLFLAFLAFYCQPANSFAQGCDSIYLAPDSVQLVADSAVRAYVKIGDTMYIAGSFHAVGKPTGSFTGISKQTGKPLQQAVWPKIAGTVNFAVEDGHGGWIIGGHFQRVGDFLRNNLIWIDSSAQVKSWHPTVTGEVLCGLIKDSVLYIGGDFTAVNDSSRNMLAGIKLNASADLEPLNIPVDGRINAMALWNNNLWIGGAFNHVAGMSRNKLTAIDLATNSPVSEITNLDSLSSEVNALMISDTNLYAGGDFTYIQTQANGVLYPRKSALCLNAQTAVLKPWICDLSSDIYNDKVVFAFDTIGSNIVLAGSFAALNGIPRTSLGFVDRLSGQVQPFSGGVMESSLAPALSLCHDDSLLYVGNARYAIAPNTAPIYGDKVYGVAVFDIATGNLSAFKPVVAPVQTVDELLAHYALSPFKRVTTLINKGGDLYIGGKCKFIGGSIRNRLAAFVMTTGELTPFTSNLFDDNDSYYGHYDKMWIINNMVSSNGKLFLSGRRNSNVPGTSPILACDLQTGNALTFPDSNWVAQTPDKCYSLAAYNGNIYADVETLDGSFVWRFNDTTLKRDHSWSIDYPFGTMYPGPVRILSVRNNVGYIEMADANNYNFYLTPYDLNTGTALNVSPITVPIIMSMWEHQVNHLAFIGNKGILTGEFDRIQSPYPNQHIQYSIGMVGIDNNNDFFPIDHPLDEYNNQPPAAAPSAPVYESLETYKDRIYSLRLDRTGMPSAVPLSPRVYDTAGNRLFSGWNPGLNPFAENVVPINKDTVVIFNWNQILEDRPYYGMARFHLGQNPPSIQISAQPGTQVAEGTAVDFSAQTPNSNATAQITWYRNNQLIPNAIGAHWQGIAGTDFSDNDSISAGIAGGTACTFITNELSSNVIVMDVTPLSINGVPAPASFQLFPNPNDGLVFIKGIKENLRLEIFSINGKKEKETILTAQDVNKVNIKNLPSGNYLFKFTNKSGQSWTMKVSKI